MRCLSLILVKASAIPPPLFSFPIGIIIILMICQNELRYSPPPPPATTHMEEESSEDVCL